MSEQNNTALAAVAPRKTFEDLVKSERVQQQLAAALPRQLTVERFTRVLMTATLKNPQILECTQESIFQSIYTIAAAGLEVDGRRAHIVPLRNRKKPGAPLEANAWFDYKGVAELVMRSGLVSNIHADIVCENDVFEYDRGELRAHKIDFRKPRGKMYAAYCIIRMKDGGEKVEVMGLEQIDAIRQRSMGKDADTWKYSYEEMAKKTVFRRASKWVPLSPEAKDVIDHEEEALDVTSEPAEDNDNPHNRPPPPARKPRGAAGAKAAVEPRNVTPPSPSAPEPEAQPPHNAVSTPPSAAQPEKQNANSEERTTPSDEPVERDASGQTITANASVQSFEQAAQQTEAEKDQAVGLKDGETIKATVQVVSSSGFNVRMKNGDEMVNVPSVRAHVKGGFTGEVLMRAAGLARGNDVEVPDYWKPGAQLVVEISGKKSTVKDTQHPNYGRVVAWVTSAAPVTEEF